MDIWVRQQNTQLVNLRNCISISEVFVNDWESTIYAVFEPFKLVLGNYNPDRSSEIMVLIESHINAIGTNNFNNLPMVYVMPIE